jgi:squalene-hopene/tetraprenyl-beta-curcumene cyclase
MELEQAIRNARCRLLADLQPGGLWQGELSSSALATAVASFALKQGGKTELAELGFKWLRAHRNADGGWGDSPESPSNPSATLLCRCALDEEVGSPQDVARTILEIYGSDRTFSAPILTMCMLTGKLGDDWSIVPQLPFELAVFPHRFYRFLRLPVVSYALPALIAIGLVRHVKRPARFAFIRNRCIERVLDILQRIQPESGGFLEAAPPAGFVSMSLAAAGFRDHPVTRACFGFLENTMRPDGSWPIDINLSTWVTSLAARALDEDLSGEQKAAIRKHLLKTQWKQEHPFTHSEPGGWGWTYEDGGVPDADDTAAALLALRRLDRSQVPVEAVENGIQWLLDMQNRDGGMPTFCKGWGKLPFDRSCPDLTAHAIRAFMVWHNDVNPLLAKRMVSSIKAGLCYLEKQQHADGSWLPLWFGSQADPNSENPVYGTVRVLEALQVLDTARFPAAQPMARRGLEWLDGARNPDGSWGNSIEETALAAGVSGQGIDALLAMTKNATEFPAGPIGLYFASLWYAEKLYPLIFTLEALKRYSRRLEEEYE